jgi:tetratricopeptide (TPR) repeat protein
MLTQIIFFLSLAAFIVILARRYSQGKVANFVNLTTVSKWGRGVAGSMISVISKAKPKKLGLPTVKFGKPTHELPPKSDHEFWQEESFSHKPEISSHFEEGENLMTKGKIKEAEQFFLKAAANNPSDAKVYAKLGLLYLNQKNYSDAIEALKMAVKLEKYNPSRHYNLALAYWGNKDTRRAIASVREAISLDPVTPKYRKLLEELLNG